MGDPADNDVVVIDHRFRGSPTSGNGGYVCGLLARHVEGPAKVRLRMPPPLERPLQVKRLERGAVLLDGETVVAQARPEPLDLPLPEPPVWGDAEKAAAEFRGFEEHWFPGCFVCGPERAPGDGLRIFAGPLLGRDVLATPWQPDASLGDDAGIVRSEFLWAALDCPGSFTFETPPGKAVRLGELVVEVEQPVPVGARTVVAAWALGQEGRKRFSGTALFDERGRPCGRARATWIEVDAET